MEVERFITSSHIMACYIFVSIRPGNLLFLRPPCLNLSILNTNFGIPLIQVDTLVYAPYDFEHSQGPPSSSYAIQRGYLIKSPRLFVISSDFLRIIGSRYA